ncbi:hypothetical protein ACVMB2_005844 [Sinorhizobium meliloti]
MSQCLRSPLSPWPGLASCFASRRASADSDRETSSLSLNLPSLATDIAFVGQRTAANANRGVGRQKAAKPAAKAKQAQAPARRAS